MSKAEMAVHNIDPESLRFERQELETSMGQFVVVDLICETEGGDEYRLKMFMDELPHSHPVVVDLGGLTQRTELFDKGGDDGETENN